MDQAAVKLLVRVTARLPAETYGDVTAARVAIEQEDQPGQEHEAAEVHRDAFGAMDGVTARGRMPAGFGAAQICMAPLIAVNAARRVVFGRRALGLARRTRHRPISSWRTAMLRRCVRD